MKLLRSIPVFVLLLMGAVQPVFSQPPWHNIERKIRYQPDGEDFVLAHGTRRFNRALYGGNSAFRVEAGDLPEFAMYLPGMGGNLKFGLVKGDKSKWLINAKQIETRYRSGSMIYTIKDSLLGNGSIDIVVLSVFDKEALILKLESKNVDNDIQLIVAYGGATGTKFSRDGDIGADPESSFYLKKENCQGNFYKIQKNAFTLYYGSKSLSEEERYEIQYGPAKDQSKLPSTTKTIQGVFPTTAVMKLASASNQSSPLAYYSSVDSLAPALAAQIPLFDQSLYFYIQNGSAPTPVNYNQLAQIFNQTESTRSQMAGRIKISTPDPYINTLGGALSMAADAIWESPSYMHGAVAWRMRLPGWRGAYTADVLGWHDRARTHFNAYALSQVTAPLSGPVVMDSALHLARGQEKMGTSMFSSGYISRNPGGDQRPHHYDMNLVFIDQLLNHFLWNGDTAYVREMWPLLKRHLDWEKRNFDVDGDGLYDAYAVIWASDALQYSGGGVAHSSAYNFRANKMAARLAKIIGEDSQPYQKEADRIFKAMNSKLWLKDKGWFAEYKDLLGKQLVHPAAAIWTVYHTMESSLPDPFQAYQMLQYVDNEIPHIPILAKGFEDSSLYVISTTNWQPYTWSLNNVVLGETVHTALAYWQGGRKEEAYKLWKGALIESMYLGASPANFQQISFYDAVRGELYRDFADDIGMTARSLVEGLFGINPDVLKDTLFIRPGLPAEWNGASLSTPDIDYTFSRKGNVDTYSFTTRFNKKLNLLLCAKALMDDVEYVMVNGKKQQFSFSPNAIGAPEMVTAAGASDQFKIEIKWKGKKLEKIELPKKRYTAQTPIILKTKQAEIIGVYDPQRAIKNIKINSKQLTANSNREDGTCTFFVKCRQNKAVYWMPVSFKPVQLIEISVVEAEETTSNGFTRYSYDASVINNSNKKLSGKFYVNSKTVSTVSIEPGWHNYKNISMDSFLIPGTNLLQFNIGTKTYSDLLTRWSVALKTIAKYEKIDLSSWFNDEVNKIFSHQYLSPRPKATTLQLPTQGIGNWAYALVQPVISDSGLRKRAGEQNEIVIKQGIPFRFSSTAKDNISFVSQWDNFPDSTIIPLKGKSSHAYLLMAGTTNPMQSQLVNGEVVFHYKDGTSDVLQLKNPENWWPIEQDLLDDGFAFTIRGENPVRVHLKTGIDTQDFSKYNSIRGFSNRGIDGGAATVLDIPLDPNKELKSLELKAIANDVVIGLMSLTLVR